MLVALAIGVIIASAFVSLGALSVRNSTFSSNQARATQLATEGIEAMISIRDQNTQGAIQGMGATDQWIKLYQSPSPLGTCTQPGNLDAPDCTDFTLINCSLPIAQRCIQKNAATSTDPSWRLSGANAQFARKIRIIETGVAAEATSIKNVTVFVWWTDASGRHESVLSRKLYRDRLE